MPKTLLIVFCLGISCFLRSQDFSNKGKDFWVGYGTHVAMYSGGGALNANGGSQNMVLYFTSDQNANVTVTIPATGWVRTYSVTPNTVTETEIIPKTGSADARLGTEGVSNKGIHITSDRPIVAYSHIYDGSVSGASILFPTNTLGRDYYTLGFTQTSNSAYSYPFCFVIATEDNTVVEVTPSANTLTHAAGITFTQTLQKGEILNLLGQLTGGSGGNQTGVDLTGTRIRSISSGSAGCKKIAVFCGSGKINIKCNPAGNASADNTIQQCFPASAWGKKYITVPTRDMPYNFFRVMVNSPSTIVKLNGTVLNNLTNNRFYEFQSSGTNLIEANEPVTVAQFITTANQCGNTTLGGNGDPEMIYLSPVEQTLNRITLNSTFHAAINANYHYINVVMKTAGVNTFKFDGNKISGSFSPLPSDPSYSYTQIKTTAGIHNLLSDSGFNAIAYGYGSAESYGYNAGTNIVDLYQFVTLQNQYAAVNFPATCKSTPFFYAITLPYLPTSLTWDFNSNPNLSPNANITNNSPVPDSTFTRDGRTLYVFKLPGIYTFSAVGTYPIKVIANNPVSDGCSGEQEIIYDVEVFESPKADFTFTSTGCLSDSLNFNEATNTSGRPISKWIWNFGDNTTDTIKQPKKIYNTSGVYKVKLQVITDIGCISDTIKSVTINPEPIAKFGIAGPKCVGSSITFSDSSTLMEGTITQWNWDFGDGTTISSTTGNNQIHEYLTPGTFIAKLQVESALGCKSFVVTSQILVSATPYVDFSLPSICLPDGKGQFRELSTISDGTSSFFTYSWNFGDAGTSTIKDPIHNYTSVGPFSVKLTITSSSGCMKDSTKQLTTIYAQPKAAFTSNNEICLRDSISFTDASNGSGNSISKWRWEFGDGSTDTIQNPTHLYLSANSYAVKLFVVTDKGCVSDTASKSINVNKLPVADFTTSVPTCEGAPIIFTNQSLAGAGTTSNGYYSFGDGTSATYLNGNPFEKIYTNANTYTLKLAVQNSKGCKSDTATRLITINKSPVAHFLLPEVCLNDAFAEFKDSSYTTDVSTPFSYAWNFGDANATPTNPNTSTAANPRHKYSATGTYDVALTVTNVKGCTNTISYPFTVNGSVPKASFEVLDSNKLCSNTEVTIKQTSGVDFGAVTTVEI
ncbi:MAG: hypothetical protein JWQ96_2896, partial [Segetibacter sp.]|nr:hypothetical protein [Segetibacter sp.]